MLHIMLHKTHANCITILFKYEIHGSLAFYLTHFGELDPSVCLLTSLQYKQDDCIYSMTVEVRVSFTSRF